MNNLSEEEKKAIENLKYIIGIGHNTVEQRCLDIVLNLINKQQKEIEELKSQNNEIVKELKPRVRIDDTEYIERNFISKDKIKEKLNQIYEEYQEILNSNRNLYEKNVATFQHNAMRTVLEELLEE